MGPAADAAGLPAVWWQQDIARENPDELRAAGLPVAAIVCSSDHALTAQRTFAPDARLVKLHPGVPVAEIAGRRGSGGQIRASLGWKASSIVGIVGRLERWKGQEVFLRAASLVAEERPDVRFAVIGGALIGTEGTYPDDLRQLARELGLARRVRFTGHQDDPYPWFDALDVAVHASRAEPFGLVVVEAMALGKPVVATLPGGPAEIVEEGLSGLLVPFGEPEALADAIARILNDRMLAATLGREASRRAHLFSEERMADSFAALLEGVLADGGRSAGG
jgi:glycosyltransferase involved in cell wall biosynthesis